MNRTINGVMEHPVNLGYGCRGKGSPDLSELIVLLEEADEFDDLWDSKQARPETMSYYTNYASYFGMTVKTVEELQAEDKENYEFTIAERIGE